MPYLLISIFAYLLNGVSLLIDKSLVTHDLKSPFVYTFYIGILSLLTLLLIPFGFTPLNPPAVIYSVLSGITFIFALLLFFSALKTVNVTVVSPIVGTFNPVFALLIGFLFLSQRFSTNQYIAFALLTLGGLILTLKMWWGKHRLDRRLGIMVLSGFLFGLSYVLLYEAFQISSLIVGLVVSRLAMAAIVLLFLFYPHVRQQIFASKITKDHFQNPISLLVFGSQLAGAVSGLLIALAISKIPPALVNSFHGLQYLLLISVTYILSKNNPQILEERIGGKSLETKIIGALLIVMGLYLLAK